MSHYQELKAEKKVISQAYTKAELIKAQAKIKQLEREKKNLSESLHNSSRDTRLLVEAQLYIRVLELIVKRLVTK